MRKIISLIVALMIFSFSVFGEAANASTCPCEETTIERSSVVAHADASFEVSLEKDSPLRAPAPLAHDCHFGHCGFTLLGLPEVKTPTDHVALGGERPTSAIPTGYRSETLRPPSRA